MGWTLRSAAAATAAVLPVPRPAHPATRTPWATAQLIDTAQASSLPPSYSNAVVGEERNCQSPVYSQDSAPGWDFS